MFYFNSMFTRLGYCIRSWFVQWRGWGPVERPERRHEKDSGRFPNSGGWYPRWSIGLFHHTLLFGSQAWSSMSFVPPVWGANSTQNCRSCSFCSHKQRCWTVLSELWYEVASNLNTFFLSWKQRTAVKVVENARQYIKMYAAGVWAKTAEGYFKTVDEQVIVLQSKVWSNL